MSKKFVAKETNSRLNRLGAGGAALFPFITGQVAGKLGILIMPIACIIMSIAMLILWVFLPSHRIAI